MKFNWLLQVTVVTLVIYLSGCTHFSSERDDKEMNELISAYFKYDQEMNERRKKRLAQEIEELTVRGSGNQSVVTATLKEAFIPEVVTRLFEKLAKDPVYKEFGNPVYDDVKPHGKITTHFDNMPLLDALNIILKPSLLVAEQQGNRIVIKNDPTDEESSVYQKVALSNLDLTTATGLLNSMFPAGGIQQGLLPSSNTLYLKGSKGEVSKASQFLLKMDTNIPHVVIEVFIVEFNVGELQRLGARFSEFADKKFSGSLDYGKGSNAITFNKDLSAEGGYNNFLTNFKAAVDILINNDKARLISRPYIATLSGQPAEINITSDRWIIVDEASGAAGTQEVQAGVLLKITPTVLAEHKLKMTVNVTDSQFSDITPPNVSVTVDKNHAKTLMQVEDGQPIIIGGLNLNRRAWGNTGFPLLRHIPIVNLFFANRSNSFREKEVMIYVTPHIWKKPGLTAPIVEFLSTQKNIEKNWYESIQ
ncbi:hypothetical protein [Candidatus Parabeggiatoa sp. HSG14]|uniref:hypothetical protein n=1 Tax=Candidatus Parabeggiatoa sp. HSG14 TaxID=3055593 RepID=UPI0025A774E5|nr:hypothetical protein [Thiotrichales bacterium HSG14]